MRNNTNIDGDETNEFQLKALKKDEPRNQPPIKDESVKDINAVKNNTADKIPASMDKSKS